MRAVFLILITVTNVFGQLSADVNFEMARRQPVGFSHVPFLVLRFNPSEMLGYNNTYQVGAELAPPFGKFSYVFDYGFGKGKNNLNKYVKQMQPDNKNREFRGELRAYFSDWFPFYALDKKPFGRYYALEYINGKYERNLGVPVLGMEIPANQIPEWLNEATIEQTHVAHIKFGRHIHLNRHLFLDLYGGVGAGMSQFKDAEGEIIDYELYNPVGLGFLPHKYYRHPGKKKYFFSKTFGVRIAVPL